MKQISTSIILAVLIIGGAIFLSKGNNFDSTKPSINNVFLSGDEQIVEISARGGYFPRMSLAKAETKTILRVKTNNTFDCSSFLVVPALNYKNSLPRTGNTDIEIPPQKSGAIVQGLCGMGMYNFQIKFE